ncbi:MAG: hypothetical protein R2877_03010 [Bdellovibrionota bacterium]
MNGSKSPEEIVNIVGELKDYEKEAFHRDDEISLWIQKLATQFFHSRLLCLFDRGCRAFNITKLTQDKLHSMDCLVKECQKYMENSKTFFLSCKRVLIA